MKNIRWGWVINSMYLVRFAKGGAFCSWLILKCTKQSGVTKINEQNLSAVQS